MDFSIPYKIGEKIKIDGRQETIKGIHIYVKQSGEVDKFRFHIGSGRFITVENNDKETRNDQNNECSCRRATKKAASTTHRRES